MSSYYAVLDLGSHTISMVVRTFDAQGALQATYCVSEPSQGIEEMRIVNNNQVRDCIKRLQIALQTKLDFEIREVYVAYLGGAITSLTYVGAIACEGMQQGNSVVSDGDFLRLMNSYQEFKLPEGKVLIDLVPLSFKRDNVSCRFQDLEGAYAKNISCEFHLFLADEIEYSHLLSAMSAAGVECKGTYVGLRACGCYLAKETERAVGLVNFGYAHSEIGYFEFGVLMRYMWHGEGWASIRRIFLSKDPFLCESDLDDSILEEKTDFSQFKPEWNEDGNNDRDELKLRGGYFVGKYLLPFRNFFTQLGVNALLKRSCGVRLTGGVSLVKGLLPFFVSKIKAKLPVDELYMLSLPVYSKPKPWMPLNSKDANASLALFSTSLGLLELLAREGIAPSGGQFVQNTEQVVGREKEESSIGKIERRTKRWASSVLDYLKTLGSGKVTGVEEATAYDSESLQEQEGEEEEKH